MSISLRSHWNRSLISHTALFQCLFTSARNMSQKTRLIRTSVLLLILTGLSLGQALFWDTDRCLDAGGAYDYSTFTCYGAAAWYDSLLHGGGAIQLWIFIVVSSAAATFILDAIWRRVFRRVGKNVYAGMTACRNHDERSQEES